MTFRALTCALAFATLLFAYGSYGAAQSHTELIANHLNGNPSGGDALVIAVRQLVLDNPAALPDIIAVLRHASTGQQSAIGKALAQAALAIAQRDPEFANTIQTEVVSAGIQSMLDAYKEAVGDATTASIPSSQPVSGGSDPGGPSAAPAATPAFAAGATSQSPSNFSGFTTPRKIDGNAFTSSRSLTTSVSPR